jgi:hypothetical protein
MIIIRDTREKYGWSFEAYPDIDIIDKKLQAGDYTIQGCESSIIIERKSSVTEIANNLGKDYARFCREFDKLSTRCKKYIVCEFEYSELANFPKGANIPDALKAKIRVSGNFLKYRVLELEQKYYIKFVFAGSRDNAENETFKILSEYNETENASF